LKQKEKQKESSTGLQESYDSLRRYFIKAVGAAWKGQGWQVLAIQFKANGQRLSVLHSLIAV
jgi:hypothetical protein